MISKLSDGTIVHYNDMGQRHRLDGPAVETPDGDKLYWVNDELHRVDGPAVKFADSYKEYWINGRRYTEEEYRVIAFSLGTDI